MEEIRFNRVRVEPETAAALHVCIFTKKLMKKVLLIDTTVDHWVASLFVQMLKGESDKCQHLTNICLFGNKDSNTEMDWEMDWKLQIDFELEEWAKENWVRMSVKDFMEHIKTWDRDDDIGNPEIKFIDDMDCANYYDYNNDADPIHPLHHLYKILRAKSHFMRLS
jgi:hypothetical protein